MGNVNSDIREIGKLIESASFLMAVRKEVTAVLRDGFVVTDGKHHEGGEEYKVVVRCGEKYSGDVTRRLRDKVANIDVDKLADGVLGIRKSRRGRNLNGI